MKVYKYFNYKQGQDIFVETPEELIPMLKAIEPEEYGKKVEILILDMPREEFEECVANTII
jgi:hypothetical protein